MKREYKLWAVKTKGGRLASDDGGPVLHKRESDAWSYCYETAGYHPVRVKVTIELVEEKR